MGRTLLVTNDFPPTVGGIQSYLRDFVSYLDPSEIVVLASTQDAEAAAEWDSQVEYTVVRWPRKVMLPTPQLRAEMVRLIARYDIETVWFGAAAPLAVLGSAARAAGARQVVATTHGHEVGWSMIPGARQVLRRIGQSADVVTYISEYTLGRIRPALGSHPRYEALPSGVDPTLFRPLSNECRSAVRARFGFGEEPLIICISRLVPRKGQDQLIRAMPRILARHPEARLVLVGTGSYEKKLRALIDAHLHTNDRIHLMGQLDFSDMRQLLAASDVFAMPARTRGKGLDVEGLGIVYLEAQACGVPVVAGASGGAPETVTEETGIVVDGRDGDSLVRALTRLLDDAALRSTMGARGRSHVVQNWTWSIMAARLQRILSSSGD
ncbi:GDP-mannose-dependent alpha-(1-6)-phosphatidylinositol monomannoside mannosyltransferase [Corynebacterium ciconiae DSM 44920]|uniref:glycosyltransferase family 4 protein n=1 Tax=Corynebacterium ciconiae TaxID=227319 RepID=UPI00035C69A5|nr:glycosyltransferase family 4 protein [Corynebacterium ciconiae]WKD60762.1 GDP-mannose-dependent alpha-(1-6)-phosphatidylinositol monomannoside mannosyltransferase [Corynebacterium ciconiae DSM 44920]